MLWPSSFPSACASRPLLLLSICLLSSSVISFSSLHVLFSFNFFICLRKENVPSLQASFPHCIVYLVCLPDVVFAIALIDTLLALLGLPLDASGKWKVSFLAELVSV